MSFLLLLSAMLSALTGVVSGGRVERAHAAVCACVEAQEVATARPLRAGLRPDAGPLQPMLAAMPAVFSLLAVEPLFASRRRE